MTTVDDVEACVRAQHDRLVRAVAVVTGSVAGAEDAVQEAFARAWTRADRGDDFTHLAGWVATVALNVARNDRRHRKVAERKLPELVTSPTELDVDARVDLQRAVLALPDRQREVVVLYYLLDLDVATVAELLGVSDGTVKTALARARDKLAVALRIPEVESS